MSARTHAFTAEVVTRDSKNRAIAWLGRCGNHEKFVGSTYEAIEDQWRMHVHSIVGVAPKAMGDQANRWQPEVAS